MSFLDLPDGLHAGVPEADYHQRITGVASKSVLELVARAPAVYRSWLDGAVTEEKDAFIVGKATHCALLEPELYRRNYSVEPNHGDCRFKENKAKRDAWRAENTGRLLLEQADATAIDGMVKSVLAHPRARRLLEGGIPELTMKWTDPETGILCKGRADYYIEELGLVVDVKTCDDARPDAFTRSVTNYGYHRQAAIYEEAFRVLGKPLEHFIFLSVEKRVPHLVGLYNLDDRTRGLGHEWMRRSLATLARCIETDEYPGYDPAIQTLSLPPWAKDAA